MAKRKSPPVSKKPSEPAEIKPAPRVIVKRIDEPEILERNPKMKVLITAHTSDEHGQHVPGDVIELGDEEAKAYIEKGWGLETDQEARTSQPVETATRK